jgi:hypothetical protein
MSGAAGTKQKGEKTIKGCIAGTSGSYTLEQDHGKKSVNLQSSQDLSAHVGHEVKVHGRWENGASSASATGSASDNSSGSMAANAGSSASTGSSSDKSSKASKDQNKTFVVDSVDMVSDQCKSGASTSSMNKSSSNPQTGTTPR